MPPFVISISSPSLMLPSCFLVILSEGKSRRNMKPCHVHWFLFPEHDTLYITEYNNYLKGDGKVKLMECKIQHYNFRYYLVDYTISTTKQKRCKAINSSSYHIYEKLPYLEWWKFCSSVMKSKASKQPDKYLSDFTWKCPYSSIFLLTLLR